MTKALITGGAGFIGSHLAEYLLNLGQEVYIIDDLSTGSIYNIQHLKENPRFHYVIDTMMHEPVLAELIDSCDVVYHLAAAVGVRLIVESPIRTIETNTKGTELVLKWAAKKKKKVIIASTSEVYGKSTKIPFTETDDLLLGPSYKGRWSYACSKLLDEFLGLAYYREMGTPVLVARLFNTVGPRQTGQYGMVIPRFVKQALSGSHITVYDDGQMVRAFSYVGDIVGALEKLMAHPDTAGKIYNIGNPEPVTIENLARRVIELTGSKSTIEYVPYINAYTEGFEDIRERVPDITKVQKMIGFEPKVSLDEILRRVIDHFRDNENV
ncbi:MAG: GDP-mannose 4,6-dehydratase [Chloroflexi bacterium]|uniref:UDP-glucuronate decarboxylase n=1 Tax=Candidatus Chlorohelix allophototropha TaxID=3003348 RepID=A0A8T7LX94_9CHLR|nr:GDP-mannose 4,6-dehydratase [Chloroflexota bacterium]WJW65968.1 GDP-mannose 4,6-dehydratase [Chloroflexota bacterium L227-S17]